LLECQFDYNVKFKEKINTIPSDELRCLPIGRDFMGKAYWFQMVISSIVCILSYTHFERFMFICYTVEKLAVFKICFRFKDLSLCYILLAGPLQCGVQL